MGKIKIPGPADIPATADIVVIGGGIVGCATAFWASQAGLTPLFCWKSAKHSVFLPLRLRPKRFAASSMSRRT